MKSKKANFTINLQMIARFASNISMQMYIALLLKGNKRIFAPGKLIAHIRLQIQYNVPFYLIIMICFTIMYATLMF